ncbi:MAG: ribbon-helix-helix domain-containing protein [Pseudomonadota bacterium]|nr:ribbon-helix-helix domain-containing protein [Pseudomonadota bacterium]
MPKPRVNIRLSHEMHRTLEQMVLAPGVTKSAIIEDALRAYLDPMKTGGREQALMKRLDEFDLRQNAIERDVALSLETLGQFVFYWLTRAEPLPEGDRDAAHALGQRRFDYFIDQVARKIGSPEAVSTKVFSGDMRD